MHRDLKSRVCAYARETYLRASHLTDEAGFEVMHGIVDSLWLKKSDAKLKDYLMLCEVISEETGIPINFEGHYKWIVFLSSRIHPRVSVLNRYVGAMDNGKIKVLGLEVSKGDTPRFIFNAQTDMIKILAEANDAKEVHKLIPEAIGVVRNYRQQLLYGEVALSDLIISKHMSKPPKRYRQQVSQVIAAQQLANQGLEVHAGTSVRFLFTDANNKRFMRRVKAGQLIERGVNADAQKYLLLLYSAAANLLSFAGYTPEKVYAAVMGYKQKSLV